MPLSENEQKLLEQMERALSAEDPRFASHMKGGTRPAASRRRIALGIGGLVLGLVLVVLGVATSTVIYGGVGFAIMVAGVAWAMTPPRRSLSAVDGQATRPTRAPRRGKGAGRRGKRQGTLNERMEERWDKRRREQGH